MKLVIRAEDLMEEPESEHSSGFNEEPQPLAVKSLIFLSSEKFVDYHSDIIEPTRESVDGSVTAAMKISKNSR